MEINAKQVMMTIIIYLVVLMAAWALNLASFQTLGIGGITLSLAALMVSFGSCVYLEQYFGQRSIYVISIALFAALFVAVASLGMGSFAPSQASIVIFVFGLVPPISLEVRSMITSSKPTHAHKLHEKRGGNAHHASQDASEGGGNAKEKESEQ